MYVLSSGERELRRVDATECDTTVAAGAWQRVDMLPRGVRQACSADGCGQAFALQIHVRPTPNPLFRRVDAQVFGEGHPVLRISTIQGR